MQSWYCTPMFRLLILLTLSMLLTAGIQAKPDRPNIVMIMADDLGYTDLAGYGNKLVDTPHLDRLAKLGMKFTDGYAASPVCTPTRASIMTGQSPARLHITNHAPGNPDYVSEKTRLKGAEWTTHLSLDYLTLAERLKAGGYATGFIGKWHLSHVKSNGRFDKELELRHRPEHQGFDLNVGGCSYGGPPSFFEPYRIPAISPIKDGNYLPERLADECIDFIDQSTKKPDADPFFLCWWNYSVHYPIEAPEHLIEKYRNVPGVKNPAYQAMIEGMDTAIGRVLSHIEKSPFNKDTLIIFTSDNGSLFDVHPLRENKGHIYEGGIRVPWIFKWEGVINPSTVNKTPIVSTDLFPTLLAAAQIPLEKDYPLDGVDLLPILKKTGTIQRDSLFFHYPNYAFHKRTRLASAIRENNWKLIYFYDSKSSELYDLGSDPIESNDQSKTHPQTTHRLESKLNAWLKSVEAVLPSIANPVK